MRKIDEVAIDAYIKAGRIASSALTFAKEIISPKRKIDIFDLAEKIEDFIRDKGGIPAFPCNISFNNIAAHYSPVSYKDEISFDEGLLKIDVGVMIDGYIADTAVTFARGYEFERISRVNYMILEEILHLFKPGTSLGKIGKYVEDTAKKEGYRPISNLSGHLIDRYTLHAGKNVPNIAQHFTPKIENGEVFAVEPFLTFHDGAGEVKNLNIIQIYSLTKLKRVKKDRFLDELKQYIYNEYKLLPFSPRWLYKKYGIDALEAISRLYSLKYLRGYHVLAEKYGKYVSQFEHTIIVTEDEPIIVTK
jgi:methionyl aminopeptidase